MFPKRVMKSSKAKTGLSYLNWLLVKILFHIVKVLSDIDTTISAVCVDFREKTFTHRSDYSKVNTNT